MNHIIVGVDGSPGSLQAVGWAAAEATRRQARLRILYAIAPWLFDTPVDPRVGVVREWLHDSGQTVLDTALAQASATAPGVEATAQIVPGGPAKALLEAAHEASMVVVGTSGATAMAGVLMGSVALQVVSYAPCPAVAVRIRPDEPDPEAAVVVGVDGSASCAAAVGFAFEEASLRGVPLHAVLAWSHPYSTGPGDMQPLVYDAVIFAEEEERTLVECLAGWQEKFPDVKVVRTVEQARPTRALAEASKGAELLVVGTRGRGGFAGLVLGSVSHAMLHRAHCPVAVVPSPRAGQLS